MSGLVKSQQSDAASLLEILQNSELLEKRLTQLRDAEAQANEVIKLAGPAAEIVAVREQLREDEAQRERLLAEAQDQATDTVEKANGQAEAILYKAQQEADEIVANAAEIRTEAQSKMAEAQAEAQKTGKLNSDLQAAEQACQIREETLNARLLELEEERQLLTDERKKLAGVRDQIANMLG